MERSPIPKRRAKARRGRIVCPEFMAFCHENFGCLVASGGCDGPLTFHHVKAGPGAQKDDTRGLILCFGHHEAQGLPNSIENLGKRKFELAHGIDIEAEVRRYQQAYADAGNKLKGEASQFLV